MSTSPGNHTEVAAPPAAPARDEGAFVSRFSLRAQKMAGAGEDAQRAADVERGHALSQQTPTAVLATIVDGINAGNLDALAPLYEPEAGFATQPGKLAHGPAGIRDGLAGSIAMKGKLDLKVTRVLEASDLALVATEWSFAGTGPDDQPVNIAARPADVLRRQRDGSWRFVIDNPWGTD